MKRVMCVILVLIALLAFTSCDSGLEVMHIEVFRFPDNIVYFVGESDSVDLTGGIVTTFSRDDVARTTSMSNMRSEWIVYYVDFSVPGVYVVQINWAGQEDVRTRFPVQVIERECPAC